MSGFPGSSTSTPPLPTAQVGTHAARPAAASVANGYEYWETDTKSLFVSDGVANWNPSGTTVQVGTFANLPAAGHAGAGYLATDVGPDPGTLFIDDGSDFDPLTSNTEMGYAENVTGTNFTNNAATVTQVTGLLISFTAGARPYYVEAQGTLQNDTANGQAIVALQESTDGGVTWTKIDETLSAFTVGDQPIPFALRRRRNPAQGTAVQYRLAGFTAGSGTMTVFSDATNFIFCNISAVQV